MKAGERDEFLRAAWRVLVAGRFEARDLVFVDECGSHTSLAPVYGYSPRGERVYLEVPRNRGPNTTLLASMSVEGMGECLAVEGATTKVLFETYVERVLAPDLRVGQVVIGVNPFFRTVPIVNFRPSGHVAPRILPVADTRGWSAISSGCRPPR